MNPDVMADNKSPNVVYDKTTSGCHQTPTTDYSLFTQISQTYGTMSARTDAEATNNQASSGVTPDTLKATLEQKLEASHVDIVDLSGVYLLYTSTHWRMQHVC